MIWVSCESQYGKAPREDLGGNAYYSGYHPSIIPTKIPHDAESDVNTEYGSHEGHGNERRAYLCSLALHHLILGERFVYIPPVIAALDSPPS